MSRKLVIIVAAVVLVPLAVFIVVKFVAFNGEVSIGSTLAEHGFIEIKPPSKLVPPGTWVTLLNDEPLHLGVICTPESSLGRLDGQLINSTSADAVMISKLKGSFELEVDALEKVKGRSEFADLKTVTFQLKNIRIVELPDDVVLARLKERAPRCRKAILFRMEGEHPVSMIKSALIADVDFRVEFQRELTSATEADLKKKLAIELDLRLEAGEEGARRLVGKDLIWGVREDAKLARLGLGLPATGGNNINRVILADNRTVEQVSLMGDTRNMFTESDTIVRLNVKPLQQSSPMSCWATVYAMMKSWKTKSSQSVNRYIAELGDPWTEHYVKDNGLPAGKEKAFVAAVGMETEPPANYTIAAYVKMLREHGPLWIITGDGLSAHARLLVGIYGNTKADSLAAYEETTFEFIDPLRGTYQYESGLEFARNFEQEARWLVDGKFDEVELRDQILHWP